MPSSRQQTLDTVRRCVKFRRHYAHLMDARAIKPTKLLGDAPCISVATKLYLPNHGVSFVRWPPHPHRETAAETAPIKIKIQIHKKKLPMLKYLNCTDGVIPTGNIFRASKILQDPYCADRTSQTQTVWSNEPVIICDPVVLKFREIISAEWPCKQTEKTTLLLAPVQLPQAYCQISLTASLLQAARFIFWTVNDRDFTSHYLARQSSSSCSNYDATQRILIRFIIALNWRNNLNWTPLSWMAKSTHTTFWRVYTRQKF